MRYLLSVLFLLMSHSLVAAQDRLPASEFVSIVMRQENPLLSMAPDGMIDYTEYRQTGVLSGTYRTELNEGCQTGEWWIDEGVNVVRFTNPVFDPIGEIGWELYFIEEMYVLRPDQAIFNTPPEYLEVLLIGHAFGSIICGEAV